MVAITRRMFAYEKGGKGGGGGGQFFFNFNVAVPQPLFQALLGRIPTMAAQRGPN